MGIAIKAFCYNSSAGGTSISDGSIGDARYEPPTALVTPIKGWHDYECGWRFIGRSADPLLTKYLDENGHPHDKRVFFSGFDLADRRDLGPLINICGEPVEE